MNAPGAAVGCTSTAASADAELADDLLRAAGLVDGLGLPADLRPVAFGHALGAYAARRAPQAPDAPGGGGQPGAGHVVPSHPVPSQAAPPSRAPDPAGPPGASAALDGRLATLSGTSGVSAADWERLVALRDGRVEFAVAKSRLPATARAATRDAVLLLGAAHTEAGLGEDTPLEEVRAQLARYGRLSSGHFREYVDLLDDIVTVARDGRSYRLLPDAWDALPATVSRLLGRDTAPGMKPVSVQGGRVGRAAR